MDRVQRSVRVGSLIHGDARQPLDPEQMIDHGLHARHVLNEYPDTLALTLVDDESHELDRAIFHSHIDGSIPRPGLTLQGFEHAPPELRIRHGSGIDWR